MKDADRQTQSMVWIEEQKLDQQTKKWIDVNKKWIDKEKD